MAIFRKVHTSIWADAFFSDLDNDKKLFYLYLLTNERTKQCGVYEITKRQMSFDTSYSIDKVSKLLKYFISMNKIMYNEGTKELALGNWLKYNSSTSPKVQTCINKEFNLVKDTVLIEYVKGIYTLSQQEQEEEQEEEQPKKVVKIPELKEFMIYAKSKITNEKEYKSKRDNLILKYESWVEAGWKDGFNKPIKNWKSKLLNNLQFIQSKKI